MEKQPQKIFLVSKYNGELLRIGDKSDGSFTTEKAALDCMVKKGIKTYRIGVFNYIDGKYRLSE
jgi:hypothetical protein